jgi:hypothetical protein
MNRFSPNRHAATRDEYNSRESRGGNRYFLSMPALNERVDR